MQCWALQWGWGPHFNIYNFSMSFFYFFTLYVEDVWFLCWSRLASFFNNLYLESVIAMQWYLNLSFQMIVRLYIYFSAGCWLDNLFELLLSLLKQVCHRDLKLENTLLDGSPAPRLKICDFGYSKVLVVFSFSCLFDICFVFISLIEIKGTQR